MEELDEIIGEVEQELIALIGLLTGDDATKYLSQSTNPVDRLVVVRELLKSFE